MNHNTNEKIPFSDADSSTLGDLLRLSVMLLLLLVGRSVVPLMQTPTPAPTRSATAPPATIGFFFAGTQR